MKTIDLVSWNINGLRAAHRKGLLEWINKTQPDILALQEIKCMPEQCPVEMQEIKGYKSYFNSAQRPGYSGTALYTKLKPESVEVTLGQDHFDVEGRMQRADFKNFVFYNVYFPNGKASPLRLEYKMDFYKHFLKKLQKDLRAGKKLIVCGDVNTAHTPIDLARPKENEKISGFLPEERAWIDELIKAGFLDTFRTLHPEKTGAYSWWSQRSGARQRNVGWRIDYFFVSENLKDKVQAAYILPEVMGSDHAPVGIRLGL
ncbi:MAG: exodeoxyribonuclease III [Candidatus Harrisonbacteria bacterium]|nr:exodeoxyribonuclease III [Candidatus Harrisonbacteria bacterium]